MTDPSLTTTRPPVLHDFVVNRALQRLAGGGDWTVDLGAETELLGTRVQRVRWGVA
jgi:hypothetical protein